MATPGAARAYQLVCSAVKKGLLPKITEATKCVDCGQSAVEYDHRDYGKPLAVEPVCHPCNSLRGPAIPHYSPRSNRGAKPLFGERMRSVLIKLDPDSIKRAKKLGNGNVSAGLRKALSNN